MCYMEEDIFDIGNMTIEILPSLSLKDNFEEQLKEIPKRTTYGRSYYSRKDDSDFIPYDKRDFTLFFYEGDNMLGVVLTFYTIDKFKTYLDSHDIKYTDYQIGNIKATTGNAYIYCAAKPGDKMLLIRDKYHTLNDDLKRYKIQEEVNKNPSEPINSKHSFYPGFDKLYHHHHNTDFKEHYY